MDVVKHKFMSSITASKLSCLFSIIFALTLFLSACEVTDEQTEEGQREAETVSQEISAEEAQNARDFWTVERMEQAEPVQINGKSFDGVGDLPLGYLRRFRVPVLRKCKPKGRYLNQAKIPMSLLSSSLMR